MQNHQPSGLTSSYSGLDTGLSKEFFEQMSREARKRPYAEMPALHLRTTSSLPVENVVRSTR